MKINFKTRYFTFFLLVLVTEIAIAVFVFHRFIRGFLGDVLVIPLMYLFLRSFFSISFRKALSIVIGFAFMVEFLQLAKLPKKLDLDNSLLQIILGATFDPLDLIAYCLGAILIILLRK